MGASKLRLPKVCEHCGKAFEAKTVTTRFMAKSFFEVPEKNYYLRGQKHYVKKSSPTSSGIIAIITEYS
ncbi:MAG: hypothetical protein LBM08_02065, partial [Dysgonamonadaceae bacterium]|nr:hypothetical protein [Dysgonamonadaceae bacterium]